MENNTLLRICHVYKSFASTKALADVSFEIGRGEIRGVIGENGSGKSTLASIIAGIQQADSGEMTLDEVSFQPESPVDANKKGVALVMQEIGTISGISVAANLFAGKEEQFSKFGILNYSRMYDASREALMKVGTGAIDPSVNVEALNLEDRKVIEIAKAFADTTKLLIIDETSNALAKRGRDILYKVIAEMKSRGGSVIFITHDLSELIQICDSVTILRDGVYIDTLYGEEMELDALKRMMVGREMQGEFYRSDFEGSNTGEKILQVKNLCSDVLHDVSFDLFAGEILGIGGLADCGMHEVGKIIFGLKKAAAGSVVALISGDRIQKPKHAIQNSIGYISKNRDTEALVLPCSVRDNVCIASLGKLSRFGIITKRAEKNFVASLAEKLSIKMRGMNQYAAYLSGGNKQKVVLAKWLGNGSKILVMDCPTRGIDIGVKEAIYKLMMELKKQGHAMIMISEELPELIGMSDRVIIMNHGKISGSFERGKEITEDLVIKYMI